MPGAATLAGASRLRRESRSTRTDAVSTRRESALVRQAARQARARAAETVGVGPYARIVGTQAGGPVSVLVHRDTTGDPLQATLAAVRAFDSVASISIRRAGWRFELPPVEVSARLDPDDGRAVRQQVADSISQSVIRHLYELSLRAASLESGSSDPYLRAQLAKIIGGLDEAVALLRTSIIDLVPESTPDGEGPAPAA